MSDASDLASTDRRANWVGLRTLRQRPTVAGRTDEGDTIYEIRSVQLLLVGGANHFSQLVHCSKCGRAVAGRAVLTTADLDRTPNPMFCASCSAGTLPTPPAPQRPVSEPAAPPPADSRLDVLEAQLAVVMAHLRTIVAAESDRTDVPATVAEMQAAMQALAPAQAEIAKRLDELAEKVERPGTDVSEAVVRRLLAEERAQADAAAEVAAQRLRAELGQDLVALRADLAAQDTRFVQVASRQGAVEARLGAVVDETSARVGYLADVLTGMEEKLAKLAERVEPPATDAEAVRGVVAEDLGRLQGEVAALAKQFEERASRHVALEKRFDAFVDETSAHLREIHQMQAAIDQALETAGGADEAVVDQLREALSAGRGELRAEVAALARRIDEQSAALAAELAAHRREAGAEAQDVAQETLGALAEPLRALTGAHQETEQRLAALTTWANATAARQEAVEQKLHDALDEVRRLVESEQARKAALRKRGGDRSGLLDSLEQQLRAAAERLAQH